MQAITKLPLALLLMVPSVDAYSSRVACSKPLAVGESFGSSMSGAAVQSTTRSVAFYEGLTAIPCGGTYTPGATLTAKLSSASGQHLMELSAGSFTSNGICGGLRVRNVGEATLTAPSSGQMELWAAHSDGCMTVRITPKCTLTAANAEGPVTPASTSLSPSPSPPPPPSSLANTIQINFDEPRSGAVCYRASTGDQLNFYWSEYHNLHSLPSKAAYDLCEFGQATQLAAAGPQPGGVVVTVTSATEQFFACSKICASNDHKVHICIDGALCDSSCRLPEAGDGASSATAQQSAGSPAQTQTPPPPRPPPPLQRTSSLTSSADDAAMEPVVITGIICGSVGGLLLIACLFYRCCGSSSGASACPQPRKV